MFGHSMMDTFNIFEEFIIESDLMKILIDSKILDLNNDKLFGLLNSNDIEVIFYNLTDEHKINGKLKKL